MRLAVTAEHIHYTAVGSRLNPKDKTAARLPRGCQQLTIDALHVVGVEVRVIHGLDPHISKVTCSKCSEAAPVSGWVGESQCYSASR
jgi:hypothetical protein